MKTNRTNRDAPGSSVQESFEPVFAAELEEIRIRRESVGIDASGERLDLPAFELFKPSEQLDDLIARLGQGGQPDLWTESHETDGVQPGLVGLALSGGGIRSSTFNLGIMQALHKVGLFPYIDYLSTVSGGGYVGTYVSTAILEDNEEPQAPVGEPEPAPSVDDSSADPASEAPVDHFPITHKTGVDESKRFRHLRNYASFLNPGGKAELLAIPIVLLRGIVVNLMVILPALLAIACWLAAMMQKSEQTVIYPNLSQLHASLPFAWASHAAFVHFPLTMMATALLVVLFAFYPLIQFLRQLLSGKDNDARRLRSAVLTALRIYLVVIGGLVFFELQPIVLSWLDSALTVGMTATIAGSVILSALFAEKVVVRLKEVVARLGVAIYGILGIGLVWLLTLFFTRQVLVGTWSPGLTIIANTSGY